ncbi:MAG: chalcone isomerase family protein [bacterium]
MADFKTKVLLFLLVSFLCSSICGEVVNYPKSIQLTENSTLPFRNYAVFAPASFSLYSIGLYVAGSETDNMKLKNADEPMAIELVSLYRYLKMRKLISELKRGFSYGMSHDKEFLKTIEKEINSFVKMLESGGNPAKYSIITFLYIPNEGTHVSFNKKYLGTVPGLDFKKALFGIWLNDNCADNKLREQIIKPEKEK